MNFIIFWLGTSIASFCAEIVNELRLYKDLADAGYKVDFKKMSGLQKRINPDAAKITFLSMLIPIWNIYLVSKNIISYNNNKSTILNQLNVMDCLKKMLDFEKQEYLKNPTGLNAYMISLKTEIILAKAMSIEITIEGKKNEIVFIIDKLTKEITILNVKGEATKLPFSKIKEIVKVSIRLADEHLRKQTNNNLKEKDQELATTKTNNTESTHDKIQALKDFKQKITNKESNNQQSNKLKVKLPKKRK